MSKTIHIVCLDAPSPPNYGGAIDMYFKIKALSDLGHHIILHYFNYQPDRDHQGLQACCSKIHTYKRDRYFNPYFLSLPYIVASRINKELIERLNKDNHPILLEGLHCSGITPYLGQPSRVVLRMHNNEAAYYQHLANAERNFLKKIYYKRESRLLHQYQKRLSINTRLACLANTDRLVFEKEYGLTNNRFVPCFIPWQEMNTARGKGSFCLYHGNLSVSENEKAVLWLINSVFSYCPVPFVVAGKGISLRVKAAAKEHRHIECRDNPTMDEIDNLIAEAHIHVLPSMNATGVKLKLLNALLNGRFCISNKAGVAGSEIETGLTIAESPEEWQRTIQQMMLLLFTSEEAEKRRDVLNQYDNSANARALSELW